jgi:hypothetical protein
MLTFTLDTYCAIAVAKEEPDAQYVNRLIALAHDGQISLARVTTGVMADQAIASAEQASANAEVWGRIPLLAEVAGFLRLSGEPSVSKRVLPVTKMVPGEHRSAVLWSGYVGRRAERGTGPVH